MPVARTSTSAGRGLGLAPGALTAEPDAIVGDAGRRDPDPGPDLRAGRGRFRGQIAVEAVAVDDPGEGGRVLVGQGSPGRADNGHRPQLAQNRIRPKVELAEELPADDAGADDVGADFGLGLEQDDAQPARGQKPGGLQAARPAPDYGHVMDIIA